MELLDRIKLNAKKHNKRIVLPEGYEERTIKAADIAIKEELAQIILIGDPAEINSHAAKLGLKNISKATIINPKSHEKRDHYIDMMVELRKSKGMTREEASKLIEDALYLGVLMIKNGDAEAIGPVLQGMAAPINDLSRGCSVSDIFSMIAITSNQAAGIKK